MLYINFTLQIWNAMNVNILCSKWLLYNRVVWGSCCVILDLPFILEQEIFSPSLSYLFSNLHFKKVQILSVYFKSLSFFFSNSYMRLRRIFFFFCVSTSLWSFYPRTHLRRKIQQFFFFKLLSFYSRNTSRKENSTFFFFQVTFIFIQKTNLRRKFNIFSFSSHFQFWKTYHSKKCCVRLNVAQVPWSVYIDKFCL